MPTVFWAKLAKAEYMREAVIPLYSAFQTTSRMSHPFLGPRFKEGVDQLEQLEQRVIKMVAAGSVLHYEKGPEGAGLVQPEKGSLQGT